jgi:hypothetical protein
MLSLFRRSPVTNSYNPSAISHGINPRQIPRAQENLCIPNVAQLTAQGHESAERLQLDVQGRNLFSKVCRTPECRRWKHSSQVLYREALFSGFSIRPTFLYPSLMWVSRTSPVRHSLIFLRYLTVDDSGHQMRPFTCTAALHGLRKL